MRLKLGNFLWFIFGGAITGLSWWLVGALWCISIIGIPVGKQCFKIASMCFAPFKKTVLYGGGTGTFLLNMLWIWFSGWALAVEATALGMACCATIIGIPFGKQYFKIAKLALTPFGANIVKI